MRFAVMIEGQEDVTWEDWRTLAADAERLGFETLLRSDHYLSVDGEVARGALDAWGTICGLAALTTTLRLGTLVSPATFRHPSVLAKLVTTADHISGGRIDLGIGTGWLQDEHVAYGFPFPPLKVRMDRLAEQVEIIRRSWDEGPFSFAGEHWRLSDLDALPKPVQQPHPRLVVGGSAGPRSAALAARWADEYNVVFADPATCARRRAALDAACEQIGRDPATLRMSLMTAPVVGADERDLRERAARMDADRPDGFDLATTEPRWLVGTVDQVLERLGEYAAAGIERVALQHHLFRDAAALELIAREIVPAV